MSIIHATRRVVLRTAQVLTIWTRAKRRITSQKMPQLCRGTARPINWRPRLCFWDDCICGTEVRWCGLVLLLLAVTGATLGLGAATVAAGATTAEGRVEREVNVLLRVEPDDERRDVDELLADAAGGRERRGQGRRIL